MCIEYYKMTHLPGGLFLTDPYHLCDKNNPRDTETPSQEIQSVPPAGISRSNSDDYEQNGKAGRPGLEHDEMKTLDMEKGYHTAE